MNIISAQTSMFRSYVKSYPDILAYIILFGALTAVTAIGKILRIDDTAFLTNFEIIKQARPETFFGIGLFLAFVLLSLTSKNRPILKFITLSAFLVYFLIAFIELAGTAYYIATGDRSFDFQLTLYVATHLGELLPVLASESKGGYGVWVWGVVFLFMIAALFAKPFRAYVFPIRRNPKRLKSIRLVLVMGILGAFSIAMMPNPNSDDIEYSQSLTYNFLASMVSGQEETVMPIRNSYPLYARLMPVPATEQKPKNVVFIIMESTRAQSTTPYNPTLKTTPVLDDLAQRGTIYENVMTMVPHTSKALVGILCGVEPGIEQPIQEATITNGVPGKCMAQLLKEQGFETGFFQAADGTFESRDKLVDNFGYEHFTALKDLDEETYEHINYFGLEDDAVLDHSKKWLADVDPNTPVFATYLTLASHSAYDTPSDFPKETFAEEEHLNDYLNAIKYVDRFIGKVVESYREAGRYENTIFVIVGDHGEGFGEHGRKFHDTVIWNEGVNVPFIVFDPQNQEAQKKPVFMSTVDILPTVLAKINFELRDGEYPGIAYEARSNADPVYSHCWRRRGCMSVIENEMKFIHHFDKRPDEMYDLSADPLEIKNLAGVRPEQAQEMRENLIHWRGALKSYYQNYYRSLLEKPVIQQAQAQAQVQLRSKYQLTSN